MKAFTKAPICAKCGGEEMQMQYKPANRKAVVMGVPIEARPERLLVSCCMCEYSWDMKTADAPTD